MSLWTHRKDVWLKIKVWCSKNWSLIRPGPEARRGAVWGTLAAAAATVIIAGLCLKTGFGYAFDFAFAILFAALCIPLMALGVVLLLTILRKLPRWATGWIIGSCVVVMMLWGPPVLGVPMAIVVGLVEGVLGATIATSVAGIAGNVYFVWFFAHDGSMEKLIVWKPPAESMPAKLAVADPGANGPYRVQTFLWSGERRSAAGIRGECRDQDADGGCVGFFQRFQRMEALGAEDLLEV